MYNADFILFQRRFWSLLVLSHMGSGGVRLNIFQDISIFFQVSDTYGIMSVIKVETDIIVSISVIPIGKPVILVVMYFRTYKIDDIIFISNDIMHLTSHWPIIFSIRVSRLILTLTQRDRAIECCNILHCTSTVSDSNNACYHTYYFLINQYTGIEFLFGGSKWKLLKL